MRNVIMIKDMNCENCANKIQAALESTNVKFEIRLSQGAVIIEGNSDMVRIAQQSIRDIGFTVI